MGYSYASIIAGRFSEVASRISGRLNEISSSTGIRFGNFLETEIGKAQNAHKTYPGGASTVGFIGFQGYEGLETSDSNYESVIISMSEKYGINPDVVRAVIKNESGYNASAISSAGAMGLMQLMPATVEGLGVANPFDPIQNIEGGIKVLMSNIIRYDGDLKMALAAYNFGRNGLASRGITDLSDAEQFDRLPAETKNYLARIQNDLKNVNLEENFFENRLV